MTADEQEARSHVHSHGFWLVPLSSGAFAVFEHQYGELLTIVRPEAPFGIVDRLFAEGIRAHDRWRALDAAQSAPKLNLEGIDL